jgi:hypothetical protein
MNFRAIYPVLVMVVLLILLLAMIAEVNLLLALGITTSLCILLTLFFF